MLQPSADLLCPAPLQFARGYWIYGITERTTYDP